METKVLKTINTDTDVFFDEKGNLLEKGIVKEKVVCLRPAHKSGVPQIYAEEKNGKFISHNYCHSGDGWTIMFGCVDESIENLLRITKINREEEITIIGLGCMGLTTAVKLHRMGYQNIKLVGEEFYKTASFWAGGLVEFYSFDTKDEKLRSKFQGIFLKSFLEYKEIVEGRHPFVPKRCVKWVDFYHDIEQSAGLAVLAEQGLIPKAKKYKVKFGENNPNSYEFICLKTLHVITHQYMFDIYDHIKQLKLPIEFRKVNSFQEINSKYVFNCTGLGSYYLNNDKDVYPICGHGIILSDVNLKDHDYIFSLKTISGLENSNINGQLYFMPKLSGFLGGTYLKNYYGDDKEKNEKMIKEILQRSIHVLKGKSIMNSKF